MNLGKIDSYIEKNSEGREDIYNLLKELYIFEMDNKAWWKESYINKIKEYLGGSYED